jgi:N-acetylmuramoyl-L-alanine amidase
VSPNFEDRLSGAVPNFIVLHYTGMASGRSAVDWLCNPQSKVSCHYLVDVDGTIVQMVSEDHRAWHAGVSYWRGKTDMNSNSIGIEIQNQGHSAGCPAYPLKQMQRVAELCLDIMGRHGLAIDCVAAHSDIAPGRKVDPGEFFDWAWLHRQGVGAWVIPSALSNETLFQLGDAGTDVAALQTNLAAFGYGLDVSGQFDQRTHIVVEAFQRRFCKHRIDGYVDGQTREILKRLLSVNSLGA